MKSVKFILGSQYFLYFGVLGLFLPYFNLYCYHLDFSGFQIGVLSSLRTLTTALFPVLWGALADKFFIRRPIYIFCSFISTAIWALFLLTTDFWAMFAITAFYGIFYAPIIAFLESFSMDLLGTKKTRYGHLRVWGSISFILTVIAVGRAIDALSTEIIVVLILAGSLAHAFLSLNIPAAKKSRKSDFSSGVRALLNRRVIIFQVCAFLMLVSHGTYYGFFSIHLDNLGYSSTFIGIAWALASIAEIFVMINSGRIFKRFSFENVLIFSFLVAGLRWIVLFYATSASLILISQLFHAVTYGAFHVASILYIDKLTPDDAKTMGQAVNNAVTYGFGIMVGFLFNGYFFDIIGAPKLFVISGVLAFFGGILLYANKTAATKP
jgi:PPP family 3-phenylpropionic acid transporter